MKTYIYKGKIYKSIEQVVNTLSSTKPKTNRMQKVLEKVVIIIGMAVASVWISYLIFSAMGNQ